MKKVRVKQITLPSEEEVVKERERLAYKKKYRKTFWSTVSILIVVAAISVLLSTLFLSLLQVSGDSMEPTLRDKDMVVIVKTKSLKSGDLLGFYWNNKLLLKRIVGLPGDIITTDEDENLYVNGKLVELLLDGETTSRGRGDIQFPFTVPQEQYFVLGDNRDISVDSRMSVIGCVGEEQIVGKVILRIWPYDRISLL